MSYKYVRAHEIEEMSVQYGLKPHITILLAHLLTENGALSEDRHGDWIDVNRPCALGIPQWNTCIHYQQNVYRWIKNNPEWADWRFQVNFYLSEMQWRIDTYGLYGAIRSWNPSDPYYLNKVKRHVLDAEVLLR